MKKEHPSLNSTRKTTGLSQMLSFKNVGHLNLLNDFRFVGHCQTFENLNN